MRYIEKIAARLATAVGIVYALFLWAPIFSLFTPSFVLLVKQALVMIFVACIIANPDGIIRAAERTVPKVISILSIIFGYSKKKDE